MRVDVRVHTRFGYNMEDTVRRPIKVRNIFLPENLDDNSDKSLHRVFAFSLSLRLDIQRRSYCITFQLSVHTYQLHLHTSCQSRSFYRTKPAQEVPTSDGDMQSENVFFLNVTHCIHAFGWPHFATVAVHSKELT